MRSLNCLEKGSDVFIVIRNIKLDGIEHTRSEDQSEVVIDGGEVEERPAQSKLLLRLRTLLAKY